MFKPIHERYRSNEYSIGIAQLSFWLDVELSEIWGGTALPAPFVLLICCFRWSLPEDMDPSLPRPIQMAFRQYWPHVRLHFYQGYNLGGEVIAVNPETIPPLNLSTLTILKCDTLEEAVTPNLNALIASAKRLEILDISLPADYRFSAAYGKLPPVKHLKLYGRSTWVQRFLLL